MSPHTDLTRRGLLRSAAAAGAASAVFGGAAWASEQPAATAGVPQVKPEEIGLDPRRLQAAYDLLAKWTAGPNAPVPGGAILAGRFGKAVTPRFFGRQGPEPDAEPIRRDSMFYMASVTKPVIYTAGMLLVERGLLNLNDPVTRYIPEFTGQGKDDVQVLHLFTHTCGLPDELPNNTELRRQPQFGWNSQYWQEFGSPAGGLFSTPEDYAVLCDMMLNGGRRGDVQLLSPASVRQMTTNRLDDLPDLPEPVRRTQPWGLGWRLNHLGTPDSWSDLLSRKVFGHTGSAGNVVWMDPETQGFCLIFTNYLRARAPWRLVHLSNAVASAFV